MTLLALNAITPSLGNGRLALSSVFAEVALLLKGGGGGTSFPELTGIANGFVAACQALGIALLAAMVCLIALLVFTSFGNEHKQAYARAAALGMIVGFGLLMAAPTIATIVQRMFPATAP